MNTVAESNEEVSLSGVLVLVLWTGCVSVALAGFVIPYARPKPPIKVEAPIKAEILQVELTDEPVSIAVPPPEINAAQPPLLAAAPAAPQVPSMMAVAEPSAVAFALPVEGPATIVEPAKASLAAAPLAQDAVPAAPPVRILTFGQGEGRQPAPEYPLRARREGQEGAVSVRFTVGEDGRVLAAEAIAPSPWKLLNDAAVRVVRERWRFVSGARRVYEVSIRFQLTR